ncbi:MAG: hypothetical protein AAF307_08000 [Pseudomonadota bacterium]
MSDATYFGRPTAKPTDAQEAPLRLPAPQAIAAPLFIYDCVTPIGGETLLSLILKRLAEKDQP